MPATAAAEKNEDNEKAHRFAKDQLKSIIERIERLEEEKKATSDDIKDVYAEAKGNGFDTKALRTIVRMRKMDTDERREQAQGARVAFTLAGRRRQMQHPRRQAGNAIEAFAPVEIGGHGRGAVRADA